MAKYLAFVSWASVVIEAWLLILGRLPSNIMSWLFFAFFLIVAIVSSAVASPSKKKTP